MAAIEGNLDGEYWSFAFAGRAGSLENLRMTVSGIAIS
ncbi:hypothetical protein [Methylomonas albis]|nr:hypothetical protein [Methylomonas albis]